MTASGPFVPLSWPATADLLSARLAGESGCGQAQRDCLQRFAFGAEPFRCDAGESAGNSTTAPTEPMPWRPPLARSESRRCRSRWRLRRGTGRLGQRASSSRLASDQTLDNSLTTRPLFRRMSETPIAGALVAGRPRRLLPRNGSVRLRYFFRAGRRREQQRRPPDPV